MTEEKKPRKPRAKKMVLPTSENTIIIEDAKQSPVISGHSISKVTQKGDKIEVEMIKDPTWETPIYEILAHPKFNQVLAEEMKAVKYDTPKPGYRTHPDLVTTIDRYYYKQEQMKIEYVKMMSKSSEEPARIRKWIVKIIETSVFLTIKHFEGGKKS